VRAEESPLAAHQGAETLPDRSDATILNPESFYPDIQPYEMNTREHDCYELGYLIGHADGAIAMRKDLERLNNELARANHDADRYYTEMCRRPAKPFTDPSRPSYADLERIRGNHANADRIDAQNRDRFGEDA
jgi:hypothetical protein